MKTIYKYPMPIEDNVDIPMPMGARILTVQMQYGTPCVWAVVDTDAPLSIRRLHWMGTGHPLPSRDDIYIGTVQLMDGVLVFHLFEEI